MAVFRREVADSRRWSTIPIEYTNASPRIDEFLMEVAVALVMVVRSPLVSNFPTRCR